MIRKGVGGCRLARHQTLRRMLEDGPADVRSGTSEDTNVEKKTVSNKCGKVCVCVWPPVGQVLPNNVSIETTGQCSSLTPARPRGLRTALRVPVRGNVDSKRDQSPVP